MEFSIEFPRSTNIRSLDLVAILGNLLDNALEAVQKLPPSDRLARLYIRRVNEMLVIKVENRFDGELQEEDGRFRSSKEGGIHGWGIESVRAAAAKYDGVVCFSHDSQWFRAVATLSYRPPAAG